MTKECAGLSVSLAFALILLAFCFGSCGEDHPTSPLTPCATPTFDPPPGSYTHPLLMRILCETPDATIRFTADGSDPTDSAWTYTNPFSISTSLTLKARAWKEGFAPSEAATGVYALTCSLTVTAPHGGETLPAGEPYTISWSSTVCTGTVLIELIRDGAACDTIAVAAADVGNYQWIVGACEGATEGYTIRVTNSLSGASDETDAPFSIFIPCAITVTAPGAGDVLQFGSENHILWTASGTCADTFRVSLLLDGQVCRLLTNTATGGVFTWVAAGCGAFTSGYRIRVIDRRSGLYGDSPGNFSIGVPPCRFQITSPTADTQWQAGTDQLIYWTSTSCGDRVQIALLLGGEECRILAADTANDGSIPWTVAPCGASLTGYQIRVGALHSAENAVSPLFTILPPPCSLDVTSPDGGETWVDGSEQVIRWVGSDCYGAVRIELLANGSVCRIIAPGIVDVGHYAWMVQRCDPIVSPYAIRVVEAGEGASSTSSASFTILPAPCLIGVISPNGGESWQEGADHEITWTSQDCPGNVRVALLLNGEACATIAEAAPNTGSLAWNPDRCGGVESGYAIQVSDVAMGASDMSDATFAIPAPPPCRPEVTSPAANDRWEAGSSHEIRWNPSGCDPSVRIDLLLSGTPCAVIAEATDNDGLFPWTAQQCSLLSMGYKIRVTGLPSGEAGESEQTFSIPLPCGLTVSAPTGEEVLMAGMEHEIRWTGEGGCGATVRIELLRDGAPCATIRESTENDGHEIWTVAPCGEEESGYSIRVTDPASDSVAESAASFEIRRCRPHVVSPNGGEEWVVGTPRDIIWTSTDCPGPVSITLLRDGAECKTIAASTENDGSYRWTAERCGDNEAGYAIRVTGVTGGGSDESDASFSVPQCQFAIRSPAGGEHFPRGSEQTVTWTSNHCGGLLDIYLVCGDWRWESLAYGTPDDGSFTWRAAETCSDACANRIMLTHSSFEVVAQSNPFCICPSCQIAVTSPNGGETWLKGTTHDIVWSKTGCTDSIRVELLRAGVPCMVIGVLFRDDGVLTWAVENCGPSDDYTIRVSDQCGVADTSDAPLSIPTCRLALVSPNGGEQWEVGSRETITWDPTDCGETVRISLMEGGGLCQWIAQTAPNTGSCSWTVQYCEHPGCDHKVRITDLETNAYVESAGNFCISTPSVSAGR